MNTFKKKSLYVALAGVGALGVTGAAQAVNINPDGLGQVLLYPYYTVRTASTAVSSGAYNSLLSVVNSTASVKAVKVRFLEGKNSREVLDFNLYLSPRDVWTAAIVPTADGAGIQTADTSCTVPAITGTVGFVNYVLNDGAGTSLDRTREGYVEIIEMGDLPAGTVATGVTHVNGVPKDCSVAQSDATVSAQIVQGSGGLFGGIQLVSVNAGRSTAVDAVALDSWRTTGPAYFPPTSVQPRLSDASPAVATIFNGATATNYPFTAAIDAVSAVMMRNTVMNEIVLDTGTNSGTDWVVTFPTKTYYVTTTAALPPFQRAFTSTGSCDDIGISIWDREERTTSSPINFSPPLTLIGPALCWEANVITFNNSNVLGSTNQQNIAPPLAGYQNGWARLDLATGVAPIHRLVSLTGATFAGLPVIGFSMWTYNNGNVTTTGGSVRAAYGQSFNHKYTRQIN